MNKIKTDITYFKKEGRMNIDDTFNLVKRRALKLNIKKIFVFSANGESVLEIAKLCSDCELNIYAVTFPYKQKFYKNNEEVIETGIVNDDIKKMLQELDVKIIQGVMPFQDIIIPDAKDVKLSTIINTLSLFGGGMQLCIEAVIMAFEEGVIEEGEEVISCSADTAIVASGSFKRLMFSPFEGMEIKEIICKPRNLTLTREGKYNQENS